MAVCLMAIGISGCDISGMELTRVGWAMGRSHSDTSADALGDGVFSLVKGMTVEKAVAALERDGASCEGNSCSWEFIKRETILDQMGVPKTTFGTIH
ncbi:MAG: hypothetical protein LBE86_05770 [Gemmobacter sp.]|jgi:hypothetical protein|nr:hypothetical protein [Gemmobacter sp.]